MDVEEITLHGGPHHGQFFAIEKDDRTAFFIFQSPFSKIPTEELKKSEDPLPTPRKGRYSRVGKTSDFEWDGFVA